MAVNEDMDICLNITNSNNVKNQTKKIVKDMYRKKLNRPLNDKVKKPFQKFHSIESSKSLLTGAKKRIKQKSLAAIVANHLKTADQSTAIAKRSILKNPIMSQKDEKLLPIKLMKDKKPLIKENKSNNLQKVSSETNETSVSFVKPTKETSFKTILCKTRKNDVDKEKKSLSSIYKVDDSKETKLLKKNHEMDNKLDNKSDNKSDNKFEKERAKLSEETSVLDNKVSFNKESNYSEKLKKPIDKLEKSYNMNKKSKRINTNSNYNGKFFSLFQNNPPVPNIGQRFVKPINEMVFSAEKFSELFIHAFSVSNLEQNMKITTMTMVQKKAIPVILSGRDTLIRSQTGSGKTLAYALPIIESLHSVRPKLSRRSGIMALVIVPTRELALQTYECFLKLIKPFTWLVPGYLVGGEKRKSEKARLRKSCNILVATPGRLLDHIKHTKVLKLDSIKYFVLDEADRMFDMGYEKDISEIVDTINNTSLESNNLEYDALKMLRQHINPNSHNENQNENVDNLNNSNEKENDKKNESKIEQYHSDSDEDYNNESDLETSELTSKVDSKKESDAEEIISDSNNVHKRQTILLSATLTHAVEKLAGLTMHDPVFIDAAKDNLEATGESINEVNEDLVVPQSVLQSYIVTPPKLRMVTLSAYLIGKYQKNKNHKILIFMATQDMIDYYTEILSSVLNKPVDEEDEDSDSLVDIEFFKLHGNMSQKERTEVFKIFKQAKNGILLCTDVAARGLDLSKTDIVVQYTAPTSLRDYVHRIGRTARAGSSGTAIVFLTPPEVEFVRMLEARRIRIKQDDMDDILGGLMNPLSPQNSVREAAIALQDDFENLILENKKLYNMACKAYTSWVRFYSSYPREMREVFNRKNLHLGHYAKSFALRDPPQKIGSSGRFIREKEEAQQSRPKHQNRLSNQRPDRVPEKGVAAKGQQNCRSGMLKNVRMLNTSEYDSGLKPIKKSKKS